MLCFTMAIYQSESRTQECHVRMKDRFCTMTWKYAKQFHKSMSENTVSLSSPLMGIKAGDFEHWYVVDT